MMRTMVSRLLAAVLLTAGLAHAEPAVSNIRVSGSEGGKVAIYYDVAGAQAPMMVSVLLGSDRAGIPNVAAMSGDVGPGVTNGPGKHIVWDVTKDVPGIYKPGAKIKIAASEIGHAMKVKLADDVPLELVRVPAGTFLMGSEPAEKLEDESPRHMVRIERDFYIGKFEITQKQWLAMMGKNPALIQGNDGLPVEQISWEASQEFIEKLNGLGQGKFRLPSEAEWEYACRAGSIARWSCGENAKELEKYAWFNANSGGTSHAVGTKQPNHFGLYDMEGNVWEWVQDWYHDSYEGAPADGGGWMKKDPEQPWKIARGGVFHMGSHLARPSYRATNYETESGNWYGLRVVREE